MRLKRWLFEQKYFQGNTPIVLNSGISEVPEEQVVAVYELIQQAYGHVGMHGNIPDMHSLAKYDYVVLTDTDDDDKPNVAVLGETMRNGSTKLSVFATDGSSGAKASLFDILKLTLQRQDTWAEIPRQFASFLHSRGVPMIEDQTTVMLLLGKRIFKGGFDWHGNHRKDNGTGYYTRNYFGTDDTRAVMGTISPELVDKIKRFVENHG